RMSEREPLARTRPPAMARASASPSARPRKIRPPVRMVSACCMSGGLHRCAVEHALAADQSFRHDHFGQGFLWDRERIAVEQAEIGQLAEAEIALYRLFASRPCAKPGIGFERLVDGDGLRRIERTPAPRPAVDE